MIPPLLTPCLLGLLLGVRHALEPDHLAAVFSLLGDSPRSGKAAWLGASWGMGHSLSLLLAGSVLLGMKMVMSPEAAAGLEGAVAVMVMGLGLRSLHQAWQMGRKGPTAFHHHLRVSHLHQGLPGHVHLGPLTLAPRPLLVGMIHGLAGSGALSAMAMAEMPGTSSALLYVALFGFGSVVSMAAVSALAGWPLKQLTQRPKAHALFLAATGLISVGIGWWWAQEPFSHLGF